MDRIITYLLCFIFSAPHLCQATDIVWSSAASPIMITEDFYLDASDRLIIEAGVEVRFLYYYKLHLEGQVIAKGTESRPIKFMAHDTVGFYFPAAVNGGWKGITSVQNPGVGPDTFIYCHFRDLKMQNHADNLNFTGNVYISHCEFYHNTSADNIHASRTFLHIYNDSDDSKMPVLKDCKFYDIHIRHTLIQFHSHKGLIQNNKIYDNDYGYGLKILGHEDVESPMFNINGNEFYNNNSLYLTSTGGNGPAITCESVKNLKIVNNKIYFNKSYGTTAIEVRQSYGNVDNNFIANNQCLQTPFYEYSMGARGGLVLMTDGADSLDTSTPTLYFRNNILSNNRSYDFGNLTLHYVNAEVTNNNFVNNSSVMSAPTIYVWGAGKTYKIKNNIFYNNISNHTPLALTEMRIAADNSYDINANAFDKALGHSFYEEDGTGIVMTLLGDTLANILGELPEFVSVATDTSTSVSALEADFNLTEGSAYIDAGQHTGIILSTVDHLNMDRIQNGIVDIGAIEFINKSTGIEDASVFSFQTYPNPCTEYIQVDLPEQQSGQIRIYTLLGQLVHTQDFHQDKSILLDVHSYSSGLYFLQVKIAATTLHTQQFIKRD